MAKPRFKRIVVKRVRDELRMEGQGATRSGQHYVKKYVHQPLEGRSVADAKKAQKKAFDELMNDEQPG